MVDPAEFVPQGPILKQSSGQKNAEWGGVRYRRLCGHTKVAIGNQQQKSVDLDEGERPRMNNRMNQPICESVSQTPPAMSPPRSPAVTPLEAPPLTPSQRNSYAGGNTYGAPDPASMQPPGAVAISLFARCSVPSLPDSAVARPPSTSVTGITRCRNSSNVFA